MNFAIPGIACFALGIVFFALHFSRPNAFPESVKSVHEIKVGDRFAHVNPGKRGSVLAADGSPNPAVPFVAIYTVDKVADGWVTYTVQSMNADGSMMTYRGGTELKDAFEYDRRLPSVGAME